MLAPFAFVIQNKCKYGFQRHVNFAYEDLIWQQITSFSTCPKLFPSVKKKKKRNNTHPPAQTHLAEHAGGNYQCIYFTLGSTHKVTTIFNEMGFLNIIRK